MDRPNNFSIFNDSAIDKTKPETKQGKLSQEDEKIYNIIDKILCIDNIKQTQSECGEPLIASLEKCALKESKSKEINGLEDKKYCYNNHLLDPKIFNELMNSEKDNYHKKIENISSLSPIDNNASCDQKLSATQLEIYNEDKVHYIMGEKQKFKDLEISQMEFSIGENRKVTDTMRIQTNEIQIINEYHKNEEEEERGYISDSSSDKDANKYRSQTLPKMRKKKTSSDEIKNSAQKTEKFIPRKGSEGVDSSRTFLKLKLFEKKEKKMNPANASNNSIEEILCGNVAYKEIDALFFSVEILGRSLNNKNQLIKVDDHQEQKSIWSTIFPFKCGNE